MKSTKAALVLAAVVAGFLLVPAHNAPAAATITIVNVDGAG